MAIITIASGTIPYSGAETTLKLRCYNRRPFISSSGVFYPASELHSPTFLTVANVTVTSGVATYAEFTVPSTTDADSNDLDTYFTFALYTSKGQFVSIVANNFRITTNNPTCLSLLAVQNAIVPNPISITQTVASSSFTISAADALNAPQSQINYLMRNYQTLGDKNAFYNYLRVILLPFLPDYDPPTTPTNFEWQTLTSSSVKATWGVATDTQTAIDFYTLEISLQA